MLKIRPHHLMCMQMYTGHGYDCKFVLHMNEVVSKLDEIIIQEGCDEICTHCPNKKGQCVSYKLRRKIHRLACGMKAAFLCKTTFLLLDIYIDFII